MDAQRQWTTAFLCRNHVEVKPGGGLENAQDNRHEDIHELRYVGDIVLSVPLA